jgi:hypothetical protein
MTRQPKWFVGLLSLGLVAALAVPALAADTMGKLKSVTPEKKEFVLTDIAGKDWPFQIDPAVRIVIAGKPAKFEDLKAGDEVILAYTRAGDKLVAIEIHRK